MPLDSTTYTETEPTLDDLIAWLETRDPNETYDYNDIHGCLLCMYGRARGFDVTAAGGTYFRTADDIEHRVVSYGTGICGAWGERQNWTMGAALSRARAWRASHAV
jgi:hypothetical protein